MPPILLGPTKMEGNRASDGHREYTVIWRVLTSRHDGPATVMQTSGLPRPYSLWSFTTGTPIGNYDGTITDVDLWAWCQWDLKATPQITDEPTRLWLVEQKFSTRPPGKMCREVQVEDPLLEPQKISGTFVKYTEEATQDRWQSDIVNSAHEQIRGPQVEFDKNRPQIRIEQNVPVLQLELFTPMVDTLNDAPLWGLPRRCIKLDNVSWERKFYGTCHVYYTRNLEFSVRTKLAYVREIGRDIVVSDFDRDILDEGTKVLNGDWDTDPSSVTYGNYIVKPIAGDAPNPFDPTHFKRYQDRQGNYSRVILNGAGLPARVVAGSHNQYVCITANTGEPLSDPAFWIPVPGSLIPTPFEFTGGYGVSTGGRKFDNYPRGSIIAYNGTVYVSIVDTISDERPGTSDDWVALGAVTSDVPHPPDDDYDPAAFYDVGETVVDTEETSAGNIHVEKYGESNFLLLNIPTVF